MALRQTPDAAIVEVAVQVQQKLLAEEQKLGGGAKARRDAYLNLSQRNPALIQSYKVALQELPAGYRERTREMAFKRNQQTQPAVG